MIRKLVDCHAKPIWKSSVQAVISIQDRVQKFQCKCKLFHQETPQVLEPLICFESCRILLDHAHNHQVDRDQPFSWFINWASSFDFIKASLVEKWSQTCSYKQSSCSSTPRANLVGNYGMQKIEFINAVSNSMGSSNSKSSTVLGYEWICRGSHIHLDSLRTRCESNI